MSITIAAPIDWPAFFRRRRLTVAPDAPSAAPPPSPLAPPPSPEIVAIREQVSRIRGEMEAALYAQAQHDTREREKLAEIINTLAESNDQKGRLIERLQHDAEERLIQINRLLDNDGKQAREIASLRAKLVEREKSLKDQGRRIGELEKMNEQIPSLRAAAWRYEMLTAIYQQDAADLRRMLIEAGLTPPPAPIIPPPAATEAAAAVPPIDEPPPPAEEA